MTASTSTRGLNAHPMYESLEPRLMLSASILETSLAAEGQVQSQATELQEPLIKWDQPPDPAYPDNVYYGWNELSIHESNLQIAADDWLCETSDPVTGVIWWGSFLGYEGTDPTALLPEYFHFAIWTDVQPDPGATDYSHPGRVIWEWDSYDFTIQWDGWDYDPQSGQYEAAFKFEDILEPHEYFYQDPTGNQIYWLSISAAYPLGTPLQNAWGWKTLPRDVNSPAPDDAVRIFDPTGAQRGDEWLNGEPIYWPDVNNSWDLAFELLTTQEPVKWEQLPDEEQGMDVLGGPFKPYDQVYEKYLADDFFSNEGGPITDIILFSSYLWNFRMGEARLFNLAIYDDIPAVISPTGYSMPGNPVWNWYGSPIVEEIYATADEFFYDPNADTIVGMDSQIYRYTFRIDAADTLLLRASTVYWLGAHHSFDLDGSGFVDVGDRYLLREPHLAGEEWAYGWKTTRNHWNDEAVWIDVDTYGTDGKVVPMPTIWNKLRHPAGLHTDLAFEIIASGYVQWAQSEQVR